MWWRVLKSSRSHCRADAHSGGRLSAAISLPTFLAVLRIEGMHLRALPPGRARTMVAWIAVAEALHIRNSLFSIAYVSFTHACKTQRGHPSPLVNPRKETPDFSWTIGTLGRSAAGRVRGIASAEMEGGAMAKDPVCGMRVDPTKAAGASAYRGATYVFCSAGCKRKFDSNPQQYAGT